MGSLLDDLRYGLRILVKAPAFTTATVVVLALGIGANTAIFSLVHAVMLETLPVSRPQELVLINTWTREGGLHADFSYPLYVDYRDRNDVFSGVAAYTTAAFGINAANQTDRVAGEVVTSNYFDLLGVRPSLGALFTGRDELRGAAPVAVVSYALWRRMFAGDPGALGKTLTLNGRTFELAGVAPPGFTGMVRGARSDIWITVAQYGDLTNSPGILERRTSSWLLLLGRLRPGAEPGPAETRLTASAHRFEVDTDNPDWIVRLQAAAQGNNFMVAALEGPLRVMMGAVGLVLLIATANVASLLLVRARSRERELAVRVSLGATRRRILRQLLTESALLSLAGGAAGLLVAAWLLEIGSTLRTPAGGLLVIDAGLNRVVLGFTLAVSVAISLFFGIVPAFRGSRPSLKEEGPTLAGSRRGAGFRNTLVVFQVALSMVLLVAAGLFARSLWRLRAIDTGFSASHVVALTLNLRLQGYGAERGRAFYRDLLDQLQHLPGVRSASFASAIPVTLGGTRFQRPGNLVFPPVQGGVSIDIVTVTPRFFETLGLPLVRGRDFRASDGSTGAKVIIVNQTMARRFWGGADPVGQRFSDGDANYEVVGVAKDTKYRDLREQPRMTMYVPLQQQYVTGGTLLLRGDGDPSAVVPQVRAAVRALDGAMPVYGVRTVDEHIGNSLYLERLRARLLAMFAALAVVLAVVGIYAVVSYTAVLRTREIGIRMALGAAPGSVVAMMVKSGGSLALLGIAAGLAASLPLTWFLRSQLFGVEAHDTMTLTATSLLLVTVALAAVWIPARRAARVDPMVALRHE